MIQNIIKLTGIKEHIINEIGVSKLFNNTEQLKLHKNITKVQYNKILMLKETIQQYLEFITLHENTLIDSSITAGEYLIKYFKTLHDKERFVMLCLNGRNEIISTKEVFIGTINECAVYIREIIKIALFENAQSVIICHNHPAGSLNPSSADIAVHKQVKDALEKVKITYTDNMIVTMNCYISFMEKGIF
jgi:DNA repair protein RadC